MNPTSPAAARWKFWIDRGGTFTDCIGVEPGTDKTRITKVLSSDLAPIIGIRTLLGLGTDDAIPSCDIRLGTTVATNALLQRRGAACGLLLTEGFEDLLLIGTQARPELFGLDIQKPAALYSAVAGVSARLDASGRSLRPVNEAAVETRLVEWLALGIRSVAVSLLHAVVNAEHERRIGKIARDLGFAHVALSHEISNELGYLERSSTCVLDAALTPICKAHVDALRAQLSADSTLRVMQSSGGLVGPSRFRGPSAVLSGPAGGVVALAHLVNTAGLGPSLGFDMGGTSTDVSRFADHYETDYETEVAGVAIRAPLLRIETVAAGGGSICREDISRLCVGPESAGATPGPLCYGDPTAEDLTLTDINLVLGRLLPNRFPFPLDPGRAEQALRKMSSGTSRSIHDLAEGFFHVANANMAEALRKVSALRGHDPRNHSLVVFGGAGGQHACALARRLGIRQVVFHPWAGVLSACGLGLSDVVSHAEADAAAQPLDAETLIDLEPSFRALEAKVRAELIADGAREEECAVQRIFDLRYVGSEHALTVSAGALPELAGRFHADHEQAFGFARRDSPVEVITIRVRGRYSGSASVVPTTEAPPDATRKRQTARLYCEGRWLEEVPVYDREALAIGQPFSGPVIIAEATATLVVEPGFSLELRSDGLLVAEDQADSTQTAPELHGKRDVSLRDPVLLEIFGNAFMSIAEQMGESLRRTAHSTNIVDRRDYSCAVFDREGRLVANAPHIPVHLGAMGETVQSLLRLHPRIQPGTAYISNDPALGGSHLPDITVVTPVFGASGKLSFFTASRGHHADVGGSSPGSMPPASTKLAEEGVVFSGLPAVREGEFDEEAVRKVLTGGPFPARNPNTNIADLKAQLAANQRGAALLGELSQTYGSEIVFAYMNHVRDDAAERVRREISHMPSVARSFRDRLDDGAIVSVSLETRGDRLRVDFSGTAPAHAGNFNAPRAVTIAAVIYFLRTLVGHRIPLNSGCLEPVDIHIPAGSLLDPPSGSAVAAGNVETSQRIVDVLLGAAELCAASQGTMNNVTLGNDRFAYYETIAGGAGAGENHGGASGVHTHMTNTRITDPEVLETRFPLRLLRFCLRRGSGGAGRQSGGDGVIRELVLLEDMQGAVIAERRKTRPFGLRGGAPGAAGKSSLDGVLLAGSEGFVARAGSHLCIETPGGGGFGAPGG